MGYVEYQTLPVTLGKKSTDDFFLDCEAAVKEFIRQRRITFTAGPSLLNKEEDSK